MTRGAHLQGRAEAVAVGCGVYPLAESTRTGAMVLRSPNRSWISKGRHWQCVRVPPVNFTSYAGLAAIDTTFLGTAAPSPPWRRWRLVELSATERAATLYPSSLSYLLIL